MTGISFFEESKEQSQVKSAIVAKYFEAWARVASFEYKPVDARMADRQQLLFQLSRPLDDLAEMLLQKFAGQKRLMHQIYEQHNVNRPYTKKNYKQVLIQLEEQSRISASPHRRNTFGDNVLVTFPHQKGT